MEYSTRRSGPALPILSHQRRSSVPRLSIIIKDSRFPDSKAVLSPISPGSRSKNVATVVVMSPRLFSPVGTPTKMSSPAISRRGSDESTSSSTRRGSRASASLAAAGRRRESIIYRSEQEYDSAATAVVERKVASPSSSESDEEFPSTKAAVAPLVTKVRGYSITSLKARRRATKTGSMQEQPPIIVSGHRRRSSIVVVHNCSPVAPAREFSEMPEESEDEA
ncbi:hypothetical protein Dda_8602 [Drechslerella dactyloides]|uniref:Uncharacterized protein n=1 Tax=Drechslerella dactyloides TaxID=74499 RepID=A0AAD6NFT4_DREDA|nr:hypothetical protein Dda_8602 [Drechslerella dactyloides]